MLAKDITADGVNGYAIRSAQKPGRQHHSKSFGRDRRLYALACERGKAWRDPLASVAKPNPQKEERKPERRMLVPDEWVHLVAATLAGPERYDMPPRYRLIYTGRRLKPGLRSGELRPLTRASVVVDGSRPFIRAKPAKDEESEGSPTIYRAGPGRTALCPSGDENADGRRVQFARSNGNGGDDTRRPGRRAEGLVSIEPGDLPTSMFGASKAIFLPRRITPAK